MVDADDWAQLQTIEPNERLILAVDWVVADAQADTGRIIITHNTGLPIVVGLQSADIDPCPDVTTDLAGTRGTGETRVDSTGSSKDALGEFY